MLLLTMSRTADVVFMHCGFNISYLLFFHSISRLFSINNDNNNFLVTKLVRAFYLRVRVNNGQNVRAETPYLQVAFLHTNIFANSVILIQNCDEPLTPLDSP